MVPLGTFNVYGESAVIWMITHIIINYLLMNTVLGKNKTEDSKIRSKHFTSTD